MIMNEDKIEEAANKYADRLVNSLDASDTLQRLKNKISYFNGEDVSEAFVEGANWALANQWHDASKELPKENKDVIVFAQGSLYHCRYHNNEWYSITGFCVGKEPNGNFIYSSEQVFGNESKDLIDYWMPIPTLTTCTKNEKI